MHRRATIRAAVVSALQGIASAPAVRVGRVQPERLDALPALNVVTGAERVLVDARVSGQATGGAWPQERELELAVELRVTGAPDAALDDALDALALEVEQALGVDVTLGAAADLVVYAGSDASALEGELEQPVGARVMEFLVSYRVDARDPQALL